MEVKTAGGYGGAIAAALAVAALLKLFVIDFMIADGRSMLPTIRPGFVLVVNRLAYGWRWPFGSGYALRWAAPKSGDLVVFVAPDGRTAVKRYASTTAAAPDDDFYALGDNAGESWDSRSYGPVPIDAILGKIMGIR
jgi:signal peptidase I